MLLVALKALSTHHILFTSRCIHYLFDKCHSVGVNEYRNVLLRGERMSLVCRQIALHEKKARARYLAATSRLEKTELPAWLDAHLEQKILPRSHSFLTRGDSLFLIVYLRQLDRETNSHSNSPLPGY